MQYFCLESGKIIVMHLKKGELVLESITEQFAKMGIKNAVLMSSVGSFRKISFHYITKTSDEPADEFVLLEDAVELGSMQGMIINGEPHFHLVCSAASTGRCYTGHLENGSEVQYLMELSFLVIDGQHSLTRKKDSHGISYIDLQ